MSKVRPKCRGPHRNQSTIGFELPSSNLRIAFLSPPPRGSERKDEAERKCSAKICSSPAMATARLAQSAERKALNLVVVGSSPTVGALFSGLTRISEAHGCIVQSVSASVCRLSGAIVMGIEGNRCPSTRQFGRVV